MMTTEFIQDFEKKLTRAFVGSFAQMQKDGVDIKKLDWFLSEEDKEKAKKKERSSKKKAA